MKYCPVCRTKNTSEAKFCSNCANNIADIDPLPEDWEEQLQKMREAEAEEEEEAEAEVMDEADGETDDEVNDAEDANETEAGGEEEEDDDPYEEEPEPEPQLIKRGTKGNRIRTTVSARMREKARNDFNIPQNEVILATVGNSDIGNFAAGAGLKKTVTVVTDKHLYYRGRVFKGDRRIPSRIIEEGSVALRDISYNGTQNIRSMKLIIAAVVLALIDIFLIIMSAVSDDPYSAWPIAMELYTRYLLFVYAGMIVYHFMFERNKSKTVFIIKFPGGGLSFDLHWYPDDEWNTFRTVLRMAMDQAKGV